MSARLRHPYAYDEDLKAYLAPNDLRIVPGKIYKRGFMPVRVRIIPGKRPHFWDFTHCGGAGGGGDETDAHIFAKKFYQDRLYFYARVRGPPIFIRFTTCAVEQRLDNRTPDLQAIISECWPPFFQIGSKFILEIHAHNSIDDNKGRREALEQIGVPCIEVHLPDTAINWPFNSDSNPVQEWAKFENYMTTVLRDPYHAEWIVPNPPPIHRESANTISLSRRAPQ
jgi:hypothetical protein